MWHQIGAAATKLVAIVGWPQLIVIAGLFLLWLLEQILAATKKVKANSITQAAFNLLWGWSKARYPLVARLGNIADQVDAAAKGAETPPKQAIKSSLLAMLLALVAVSFMGCATIYTPPGATTAQKIKDDLSAVGIVEADVKAQCGPQFAPIGASAMALLSVAEAAGQAAAYNIGGAVSLAAQAVPTLASDVNGLICVGRVIDIDYQRLKPKAAPPPLTPKPSPPTPPLKPRPLTS